MSPKYHQLDLECEAVDLSSSKIWNITPFSILYALLFGSYFCGVRSAPSRAWLVAALFLNFDSAKKSAV